jgi:uncharacterized protein (UPF0264 family)
LLVSVRNAEEAREAVLGGAKAIDVKEPARGPLGAADPSAWRAVRACVPRGRLVSVALGELVDDPAGLDPTPELAGVLVRKIGFAGMAGDRLWADRWARARERDPLGPAWAAVVYADWASAAAPEPDAILDAAIEARCVAVVVDSWDKSRPSLLTPTSPWVERIARAREAAMMVALAGGLGPDDFERLAPLAPHFFAVRGAACRDGRRLGPVDRRRVAALARAAALATPRAR